MNSSGLTNDLQGALSHYLALKDRSRTEHPDLLDWYQGSDKPGLNYSSVTWSEYLRLYYRVVWSSGFKAKTVFDKESDYFESLEKNIYPESRFNPTGIDSFLIEVAPILGGHENNRKNKAIVHLIRLVEEMGWDSFRREYIFPHSDIEDRLLKLPMIGPKTVKLLVNQTGISDTAKDDIWVTRFAKMHGFDNPLQCIQEVSRASGDDQTTVDAVVFWAGMTFALQK